MPTPVDVRLLLSAVQAVVTISGRRVVFVGDRNGRFTPLSSRDHTASRHAIPDWKKRVTLFWSVAQRLSEQGTFCRP